MAGMRSLLMLTLGMLIGAGLRPPAPPGDIAGLNQVAIATADFEGARKFYRDTMGFPEAFALKEADGSPYLSYFQVNRSTFVEVMSATPQRPAGFVHFGLEVPDVDAVVKRLRAGGVQIGNASVSARTNARIAVGRTPQGTTFELLELGPDSLQRKVMDTWK
jgi:catechol 2,3-dioxygenase-like lactoylglutathione lyase family enzyme